MCRRQRRSKSKMEITPISEQFVVSGLSRLGSLMFSLCWLLLLFINTILDILAFPPPSPCLFLFVFFSLLLFLFPIVIVSYCSCFSYRFGGEKRGGVEKGRLDSIPLYLYLSIHRYLSSMLFQRSVLNMKMNQGSRLAR